MIGGTAGRTTLAGEGLQHQDGHSHLLAYPYPHIRAYDPAFAYEVAAIVEDGLDRMYKKNEKLIYYFTVCNEPYEMPAAPSYHGDKNNKTLKENIIKGMYLYKKISV